jgi:hypothetical protein
MVILTGYVQDVQIVVDSWYLVLRNWAHHREYSELTLDSMFLLLWIIMIHASWF